MSSAMLSNPTTTHTIQVWLSDGSPESEGAAECLTPAESQLADRLNSGPRRRSFEVARWLGKQAVQACNTTCKGGIGQIEILSEDSSGVTSRPVVRVNGIRADLTISITHLDQTVAVAVTDSERTIGIDLAHIRPASDGFTDVWMTDQEQFQIVKSENPALTATMNWSAREATFKATGIEGEFRPARWSVSFDGDRAVCFYRGQQQAVHLSFYRIRHDLLLTVAGDRANVTFCYA